MWNVYKLLPVPDIYNNFCAQFYLYIHKTY